MTHEINIPKNLTPKINIKENRPAVSKKRKLMIRKYLPPQETRQRIMDKDSERPCKNKFMQFFKVFFIGDGF